MYGPSVLAWQFLCVLGDHGTMDRSEVGWTIAEPTCEVMRKVRAPQGEKLANGQAG